MSQGIYTLNQQQLKEGKKEKENYLFKYEYLLIILAGFFIGQARVSEFYTLALIYLTIVAGTNSFIFGLTVVSVGLGLIMTGNYFNLIYLGTGLIGLLFYKILNRKFDRLDLPLLNAVLYLVLSITTNYIQKGLYYSYLLIFIESMFIYILSYAALEGMKQIMDKKKQLTRLALITIFIISSGVLIGFSNIYPDAYHIINILVLVFLLGLSYVCGFNYSLIIAILYGLVLVVADVIPMIMMVKYIIITFFCSLFTRKKKIWIGVGILTGFLLYSGLAPTIYDLQETAIQLGIAFIIFLIIPLKSWQFIFSGLIFQVLENNKGDKSEDFSGDYKEYMQELAQVFNQLSVTFRETIPSDNNRALDNFIYIFKNKVCGKCRRQKICWQQERDDTIKRLFLLMKSGEKDGGLTKNKINKYLDQKCPYYKQIIKGIKNSFELQQINNFWYNRLKDKQKIVSEQLAGIGEIINSFSDQSGLTMTDNSFLKNIKQKALENNIELNDINFYKNVRSNRVYFNVEMENCSGNKPCQGQFLNLLDSEFSYDFRVISSQCGSKMKDIPCQIVYAPQGEYQLEIAHILKPCSGDISGDNYLYKPLKDGKELVAISDGMGVGKKAAVESQAAINLLESIVEAGFDQKLAIDTINSALYLRNQEENFTTLDICIFDTFSGEMTFSKIGAVSSYIKRGWELIKIESGTLPAGILDRIEVKTRTINLKKDDFVIMFSDGIMEMSMEIDDREEWLRQILQNCSFDKAGDMLDYIQEKILNNNGEINDDLTIVVMKIEEVSKKRRKFKGLSRINIDD